MKTDPIKSYKGNDIRKEELFGNENEQFSITEERLDDFEKFKEFCLKSATVIKKSKSKDSEFTFYNLGKTKLQVGKLIDDDSETQYIAAVERKTLEDLLEKFFKENPSVKKNGKKQEESFEDKLWNTAELLRGKVAPSSYKDIALGLLFLKFISYWYDQRRAEIQEKNKNATEKELKYLLNLKDSYTEKGVFF